MLAGLPTAVRRACWWAAAPRRLVWPCGGAALLSSKPADGRPVLNRAVLAAGLERVRLISPDGEQSVVEPARAIELAEQAGLDLVLVAPQASPPVCKIVDFGKVPGASRGGRDRPTGAVRPQGAA